MPDTYIPFDLLAEVKKRLEGYCEQEINRIVFSKGTKGYCRICKTGITDRNFPHGKQQVRFGTGIDVSFKLRELLCKKCCDELLDSTMRFITNRTTRMSQIKAKPKEK